MSTIPTQQSLEAEPRPGEGSLLNDPDLAPIGVPVAPVLPRAPGPISHLLARLGRTSRRTRTVAGLVALLAISLALYLLLRPTPQPDYLEDPIDDLFNYTLLTSDFNKLPIEQRLKLLEELVERLKSMSGADSAMMAAFAATIKEQARKQLEENVSRLAIDLWDLHAAGYDSTPPDQREDFLDKAFVDYMEKMEAIGGEARDMTPEERLAEGRANAQRDMNAMKENGPIPGRFAGRFFDMMHNGLGGHANPQQKARGQQMMRDMTRRLRGQPIVQPGG